MITAGFVISVILPYFGPKKAHYFSQFSLIFNQQKDMIITDVIIQ